MLKKPKSSNKEITIIGIVREVEDKVNCRICIITEGGNYVVQMNEEGKNMLYEVGNKVEVTGIVPETKTGGQRIAVTSYRVYEMDEDDLDDYGADADFYFRDRY